MSTEQNRWSGWRILSRDPIARGLLDARITHTRYTPKPYALSHRLTYFTVPLAELARLPRLFLGHNRFGLFSLNDRDYGSRGTDLASWVASVFESVGARQPDGNVVLVTLPRVTGFVFNPVSFWLCHDQAGALRAVIAEVNNTFGERHCYLCRMKDGSTISADSEIEAEKVFHVSPFLPADGQYRFRFIEKVDRLAIKIELHREGRHVLSATISGKLKELTSGTLLMSFLRHPFPTVQVITLIHYHAARIYLKGIKYFSKPAPPDHFITTSPLDPNTRTLPELR